MAETLTVVAIVIILLSLVLMGLFTLQATLRQKELDSKAEIIYMAAQDQMTKVMASGRADFMVPDGAEGAPSNGYSTLIKGIPGDAYPMPGDDEQADPTLNYVESDSLAFLTSDELRAQLDNGKTNAAKVLFGDGGLDEELLSSNWIVEYDWKSLTVYAVFYNPDKSDFVLGYVNSINGDASQYNKYRSYDGRLTSLTANSLPVGYHGGAGSGTGSESFNLSPFVEVNNDEKLTAKITCTKNPAIAEDLYFKVTVSDQFNNSYTKFYGHNTASLGSKVNKEGFEVSTDFAKGTEVPAENIGALCRQGTLYTLILNLDSLESDSQRFKKLYGSEHNGNGAVIDQNTPGKQRLVEGSNITVTVEVACSNLLVQPNTGFDNGNSLFDDDTSLNVGAQTNTAKISLGRHLQNLDSSSGVSADSNAANISVAELTGNINFTKDDTSLDQAVARDWFKTYSKSYFHGNDRTTRIPKFMPITNPKLARFDGVGFAIRHLYVNEGIGGTGKSAGLFSTVDNGQQLTVQNTAVTDACASGGNAGSFVGNVSGAGSALTLSSCRSYLENDDYKRGEKLTNSWVQGTLMGGLVGGVSGASSVSISNSSSSGVVGFIDGNDSKSKDCVVGGLVGSFASTGTLSIQSSYSDSYLLGDTVGGLVGSASDGSSSNGPADGSIQKSYSAGFIKAKCSQYGRAGAGILAFGALSGGVSDSYTISDILSRGADNYPERPATYYPTVPSSSTPLSSVYYLSNSVIPGNDSAGGISVTDSVASAQDIANKTNDAFNFAQESTPYNMLNNGLTTYTWPTISGMRHYGDWSAGFKAGSLVYYEKYSDESKAGTARVSYGFEGANVVSTLKNDGRSNNNKKLAVVGDGYGVVFDNSQPGAIPDQVTVKVTNPGSTSATDTLDTTVTIDTASSDKYIVGGYVVYPLPKQEVVNTSVVNSNSYYLKAEFSYELNTNALLGGVYYFNPHFARTVKEQIDATAAVPSIDNAISLRTARQLYNLSLHYGAYSEETSAHVFNQERNIDYSEYEWTDFASTSKNISSQKPIGRDVSGDSPFRATYNGNCFEITDVSFVESGNDASPYVGMFGNVASSSTIQNVVLVTDYKADSNRNFHVQYSGTSSTGKTMHLGVLAGRNAGTIGNCAVAGYYVAGKDGTVHAYADTTVNLGGLVGTNIGTITTSSADIPQLRLSTTFATARAGGFVGNNNGGTIRDSYSIGAIELADARGGSTSIAGFAGKNNYRISSSYAAVALTLSGENATSYGFAPKGGSVSGSSYLNGGTYVYTGKMHSHNFNTSSSSASPVSCSALKNAAKKGSVAKDNSLYHSNTKENKYPFLGKVTNANRELVHYGDWQVEVSLGTLGVFYWEHESGGNNSGYHMTYLGSKATVSGNSIKSELAQGTSLCTAHDDGGTIDSYGYGFYTVVGEDVSAKWTDIACSSGADVSDVNSITSINQEAAASLKEQMESDSSDDESYNFYAFTTRTAADAGSGDYVVLDSTTAQNGTLKLTHSYGLGTSKRTTNYTFDISPFFANSIGLVANTSGENNNPAQLLKDASAAPLESSDGAETNFALNLGKSESTVANGKQKAGNPYEIRSVQQLQYLNWNSDKNILSTNALIDQNNRKTFNYLLYASDGTLTKYKAGSASNIAKETYERADCHWVQTHDAAAITGKSDFSPIAGNATSSKQNGGKYTALAYSWFGSTFNGQSYTIKNINISSPSFNVGLFGMTIGARIKNVVMYSDDSTAKIERATVGEYASKPGAYAIGGLIGIAYDYVVDNDGVKKSQNYIENCAISGYKINDFTTAPQGLGEMNMGGLIGVANVNLRKCSAAVDMYLGAKCENGVAQFGIYDRVGGLVGGAQGYVVDCYTGGSFDFSPSVAQNINWSGVENNSAYKTFFLSVGGIAGSAFTSNYQNITNSDGSGDGAPVLENCYTYFSFPSTKIAASSGVTTKLVMSTFASLADRAGSRYADSAHLTINNGYYYSGCLTNGVDKQYTDGYTGQNGQLNRYDIDLDEISYEDMTRPETEGNSLISKLNNSRSGSNAPWSAVSSVDYSGAPIDGKFSFPSDDYSLVGKNFPFPAVITQNDLTFGTFANPVNVHVHYGNWPKVNTSYWTEGRSTMDIFDSMEGDGYAYKDFTLFVNPADFTGEPSSNDFVISGGDEGNAIAEIASLARDASKDTGNLKAFAVRIKALREGTATVTLAKGGATGSASGAVFSLQVTANLSVGVEDANIDAGGIFNAEMNTLTLEEGNTKTLRVKATNSEKTKDFSIGGSLLNPNPTWNANITEGVESLATLTLSADSGRELLAVQRSGKGKLLANVKALYDYNGYQVEGDAFVTIDELAPIGLSNGSIFNEVKTLNPDGVTGSDKSDYKEGEKPVYKDSPLYLYTSNTGDFFDNGFNIKAIDINGVSYSNGAYDPNKDFFISFDGSVVEEELWKFVPGVLTWNKSKPTATSTINVKVTLENGPTLQVVVPSSAIEQTVTATLTFVNGFTATSPTSNVVVPKGQLYKLPSASALFDDIDAESFESWNLEGTDEYYGAGDEIEVAEDKRFNVVRKHKLTLEAQNGGISVDYFVGHEGVSSLAEYDSRVLAGAFADDAFTDWYDAPNEKATVVLKHDGQFEKDNIDSFGGGNGRIQKGILYLDANVTLYTQNIRWTLADSFKDKAEYLFLDRNAATSGDERAYRASLPNEGKTLGISKNASGGDPMQDIWVVDTPVADVTVKSVGNKVCVTQNIPEDSIWSASEDVCDYMYNDKATSKTMYSLKNNDSSLFMSDPGYALSGNGNWWYIGGVEDPEISTASINWGKEFKGYQNWFRCMFTLGDGGKLSGFNKPNNPYPLVFKKQSVNADVRCMTIERPEDFSATLMSYSYAYEKSVSFDWK